MNALTVIPRPSAPEFSLNEIAKIANVIAAGGLFGSKDADAVMTLCLLAHAEGQHPVAVMRDYNMIQGKPSKKAEAMQRDFLAAGGSIVWHQLDDACADATFSHPAGGEARIDWTLERATKAGLIGNAMWKKYPRQMLKARVISEGARTVFPGATSGLYVPEEVADFNDRAAPPQIGNTVTVATDDGPAANMIAAISEPEICTDPNPRPYPPPLGPWPEGPFSSKSKLMAAWRKLAHDLNGASDPDTVEELITEAQPMLAQFRAAARVNFADMRAAYQGGGDFKGVAETLKDARASAAMAVMNAENGGEAIYLPEAEPRRQSILDAG